MERLNKRLEKTLKELHDLDKEANGYKNTDYSEGFNGLVEGTINGKEVDSEAEFIEYAMMIEELCDRGLLDNRGPYCLTSLGRDYFKERRRDRLERWLPVVFSAIFGGVLGLIGVWLGWWLTTH